MAIPNKVSDHFSMSETSIEDVVEDLVKIAQARLDASWDNISQDSLSKIHAEIMTEVFLKFGRRMMPF